ncbi:hypothetical protein ACIBQ1_09520 [Nonomuraea sp. NPDC050153]
MPTPKPEGCGGCLARVFLAVLVGVAGAFLVVLLIVAAFTT